MHHIKPITRQPLRLRATIAMLMALALLLLADGAPASGVEDSNPVKDSNSVNVTAQVELAQPDCFGQDFAISFLPDIEYLTLEDPIMIQVPDSMSDSAVIYLDIVDGQTEDCDPITGYVTFSEAGFKNSSNTPVTFLSTAFECDGDGPPLTAVNDTFTCGQGGASSPLTIDLTVTAVDDGEAQRDYYTNTISIDLFANP
jgi:hypothetical protein